MTESPKLKLVKSDAMDNWYVIERAEHDGRTWLHWVDEHSAQLMCSSRISDADVEGSAYEMREIARAIRARGEASFKRCSVECRDGRAFFRSPRNSRLDGETSLEAADELAAEIEMELGL